MAGAKDFIALDVETANADFSSICSIGLVHFRSGTVFKSLTILVDPEDEFDAVNIGIHGIRPEDVVGKPTMAQVFPVISASLSDVVVVHHSHFDKTALTRAAVKYGAGPLPCFWLDTLRVARRAWPLLNDGGGYGLARLAGEFGINFAHHDAAEDARAAGLVILRAIADTGYGLEDWLKRVELTISGQYPGRVATEGDPSGPLAGETVVFTGRLTITRAEAAKAAAKMGCNVADSVSKRITILVVGDQDLRLTKGNEKSSKHRKAEDMIASGVPIRIVGESDFILMVDSAAIKNATANAATPNPATPFSSVVHAGATAQG
jgi:DNA polymerase-3 subunit epsilon